MLTSEAVRRKMVEVEASARVRGERLFPPLPAHPGHLGIVAAAFTCVIMRFEGAIDFPGGGYGEVRGYATACAVGSIVFLWARNTGRLRTKAMEQFVRDELEEAAATLALPDDLAEDYQPSSHSEAKTLH